MLSALVLSACSQSETSSSGGEAKWSDAEVLESLGPLETKKIDRIAGQPLVRIISIPDFLNQDFDLGGTIADGSSESVEGVIDATLDAIAAENPDAVLVAGDLFNARWHLDNTEEYRFGPLDTHDQRVEAVTKAAAIYYPPWRERFTSRGLNVYPAVGDHELGDDAWHKDNPRAKLVDTYRDVFTQHLMTDLETGNLDNYGSLFGATVASRPIGSQWENTAYAAVHDRTLMVMVDMFSQDSPKKNLNKRTGTVIATVEGAQLEWLRDLFTQARASGEVDHILVTGHVPVITPVPYRNSSNLGMNDRDGSTGVDTDFWQLLDEFDVAAYFAGEVHDTSTRHRKGVTQVINGAIVGLHLDSNYLVIDLYTDHIDIVVKEMPLQRIQGKEKWSTSMLKGWHTAVTPEGLEQGFVETGSLRLVPGENAYNIQSSTGKLDPTATIELCFGKPYTVYLDKGEKPTDGDDVVAGTDGPDHVDLGGGNDIICAGDGDDVIYGGDGNDIIHGGKGNDKLYGGAGNDDVRGAQGQDEVYGGDGNDHVHGGKGEDKVYGEAGNDHVYGQEGDDFLDGGEGTDKGFGGEGTDECINFAETKDCP